MLQSAARDCTNTDQMPFVAVEGPPIYMIVDMENKLNCIKLIFIENFTLKIYMTMYLNCKT